MTTKIAGYVSIPKEEAIQILQKKLKYFYDLDKKRFEEYISERRKWLEEKNKSGIIKKLFYKMHYTESDWFLHDGNVFVDSDEIEERIKKITDRVSNRWHFLTGYEIQDIFSVREGLRMCNESTSNEVLLSSAMF